MTADLIRAEADLARRIKAERELRSWSTYRLAEQLTTAGCPTPQTGVWRIENGAPQRSISVNELVAFASVFGVTVADLLGPWSQPLICRRCGGEPSAGFTCNSCGTGGAS